MPDIAESNELKIYLLDGVGFCVLYGNNIKEGITGFGDSLAEAIAEFDFHYSMSYPNPNYKKEK